MVQCVLACAGVSHADGLWALWFAVTVDRSAGDRPGGSDRLVTVCLPKDMTEREKGRLGSQEGWWWWQRPC